jgi:hypothetical protein
MAAKKKTAPAAGLQALRIGSRVRGTDDGVEGRIAWANGVSVKIKWDDGEQVTWRRDSLAGRPIEILAGDEDQTATAAPDPTEPTTAETPPAAAELAQEPPAAATPAIEPTTDGTPPAAMEAAHEPEPTHQAPEALEAPTAPAASEATPTPAKPKRQRKATAEPQGKKFSAIDAAAKVLGETGQAMTCPELIGAMAAKGYWTSPGGKTPHATLYSAILREINTKGDLARITKAGPGRFACRGA